MEKAEEVTPLFCLPRALANFKERSADRMNEQKKDFLFRRSSRQQCTFGVLPATSIRNNVFVTEEVEEEDIIANCLTLLSPTQ
jgi:hypothetical protein